MRSWLIMLAWVAVSSPLAADDARVVRTAHFVAVGDVGAAKLEATARMFEVVAESVHQLVPSAPVVFPRPVVIVALTKRPSGIAPGFFAGPPIAYAVPNVGHGDDDESKDIGGAGVEFAKQLVGSAMDTVPLWVEVGCGEYLRTLQIDRDAASAASRVTVGAPVARHVVALRSRGLPMLAVLSATRESPAFTDADNRRQFIAQSWLLVHYLLTERSREGQLSAFLDLLERHVAPERAFQQAIAETHETIGHRLSDYYGRAVFATRELPLRPPESLDHGGKRALLPVPSLSAITSDLLAESRAPHGRGDEARALFEKAIARSDVDAGAVMLARYYYGEWLVNQGADASAANRVLTPLLDILPDHPDLLALLGLADLGLHNPGSALRRFEEAIRIFPRHEYAILIARAEIAGGDVDSARTMLEPLATHGSTAEVRTQAQRLLRDLPQATSAAPSQAVMPVFRETKPGEQRESGTLTEIACGAQWVILHVRARDRDVRVASTRLEFVNFITYGGAAPAPIACGVRQSPEAVLITWRSESTAPSGTDGIVEAVEFVPPVGK